MKLLGLDMPKVSHRDAVRDVLAALAVVIGFGLGGWMLENPLDRPAAIALFIGVLYSFVIDSFVALKDARAKRFSIAGVGAGILVAVAAVIEQVGVL